MARRPKGTGCIFQRGRIWFIQFSWRGERRRESSGSEDWETAQQLLHKRLGEIATGRYLGIAAEQVTVGALIDLVVDDHKFRKLRSSAVVEWRAKAHLKSLRNVPATNQVQRGRGEAVRRRAAGCWRRKTPRSTENWPSSAAGSR